MRKFDFKGKYIIEMDMVCQTGLHIGGITEGYEIGGMDNPVIKTPTSLQISSGGENYEVPAECPYIPGSSLKGKLRSLLEWAEARPVKNQKAVLKDETGREYEVKPETLTPLGGNRYKGEDEAGKEIRGELIGYKAKHCTCGDCDVCWIFGSEAKEKTKTGPTRLFVFDAFPTKETIVEIWEKELGKDVFTEIKPENVIDRLTSQANPRTMERVPAGSRFRIRMVYDLYLDEDIDKLKKVFVALRLLEDNHLGGSGSRGSGRVTFENFSVVKRPAEFYRGEKDEIPITNLKGKSTADIVKEFAQIFQS